MSLTESLQLSLNSKMPVFELAGPTGKVFQSDTLYGKKGLLVIFTCNHCPYAQALWPRIIRLEAFGKKLGIETVAINPNIRPDYPDDSPAAMLNFINKTGIAFPYLVDETQDVAREFKAQCTPDLYLYNVDHELVYHGRVDDNWKDETAVTKEELKIAIENLGMGKPIDSEQKPSMGCSIKWKT